MTDAADARAESTARSYDAVARQYAEQIADELAGKPVDRALYAMFAELVGTGAKVADVGCGPGHIADHLTGLGLDVLGVDASAGMIGVARQRYPAPRFAVGTFAHLPAATGEWAGAVVPYSIIHLDRQARRDAAVELARAIRPGGWLLVGFHVADAEHPTGSIAHVAHWWDTEVDLDFHFLDPAQVAADLAAAGFRLMSRTDREPWPGVEHPSRRSYLLARRTDEIGYHAATLDAVAEEAGFTKGAVYSAFDGKADLFLAVLDERVATRAREIEQAGGQAVTPEAHAAALARQFVAALEHDRQWSAVVIEFWAHASRDRDLRERFAARHEALRKALAGAFEEMTARTGQRFSVDADRLATIGLALGNGFALEAMAGSDLDDDLFPTIGAALMTALAVRKDRP